MMIYNEDCLDAMKRMESKCFDLAIVDPPYGLKMGTDRWSCQHGKPCPTWKGRRKMGYTPKDWDNERPSQEYFDELQRVSKYQVIWGGNHFADMLPPSGGWIVWDKVVSLPTLSKCELAWTNAMGHVEMVKLLWSGYKKCEPVKRIHPTQKPIALYEYVFSLLAKPNWKILDTHLGSGSSAIAAHNMGMNLDFVGCEIDKEFHEKSLERIERHKSQLQLFSTSRNKVLF